MLQPPVNQAKSQDRQAKRPQIPLPERERHPLSVETPGHPSLTGTGGGSILPSAAARNRSAVGNLQRLYGNQAVLQMRHGSGGPPAPSVPLRPSQSRILQRKCACGGSASMTGECEECSQKKRLGLQTKLKISEPGDIYEQDADRIADQVLATPAHHAVSGAPQRIQRLAGQPTGQTQTTAPASVDQVLASPGGPLEPALRQDMEQRFGYDFSGVRVHTDAKAAESAAAVDALAYTVGKDVVFGVGQYSPQHSSGRRLLAHELAHVIQQKAVRSLGSAPVIQRQAPREDRYIPPSATAGRLVYAAEIFQQSPEVRALSDANFTNIFYDRDKVMVVDFWASWCRPCDDAAAHVAYLARRYASGPYGGRVKFYHVQLEESVNPQLNKRFGFDAIPVVYFYYTATGRQPSRQAPLLEGSIQGGEASVEDYEWRIRAILRRHDFQVESKENKTERLLQRQPTASGQAPQGGNKPQNTPDSCPNSKCSAKDVRRIARDLTEALDYVNQALLALRDPTALSDATQEALDWFFGSREPATVQTIKERLGFIQHCLQETQKNQSFGCNPKEIGEAYTDVPKSHPLGQLYPANICLTSDHLESGDVRQRATTMLHECGHRIGLSLTKGTDIYSDRTAFRYLDTARALLTTESYAKFAAAIAKGVTTSLVPILGLSFGRAFRQGASNAWLGRLYWNVELQHPRNKLPVVSWVNPVLGFGVTLIGESTTGGAASLSLDKSLLATLALGVRFGDPRPGSSHRFSLSIAGGPGLSTQVASGGKLQGAAFGAEAGAALSYNWKWLHVSLDAGVGYDGLREVGRRQFYTLAGSVSVDFLQIRDWTLKK